MTANETSQYAALRPLATPLKTALVDVYKGFLDVSHNGLAMLGTALVAITITLCVRADLRADAEQQLLGWLLERQDTVVAAAPGVEEEAANAAQVDTLDPAELTKAQANVAQWLSRKYRVAQEPLSVLVAEAFTIGRKQQLDPTLILAVMAIESRFNPYAQSPVGAQGLMQVLTRVHTDKYENFGGHMAAFDPVSNLRVGVKVLQDCIKQAGSVEGGLRLYVGAVTQDGADYINKVMSEHLRIQSVALGKPMPTSFPVYVATPAPAPAPAPAERPALELPTQTGLLEASPLPSPAPSPSPAAAIAPAESSS
jgi:hypothetical protein